MVGDFILWKSLNNAADALTMQADAYKRSAWWQTVALKPNPMVSLYSKSYFLLWRSQITVTDGKTRKVN
ncbi:hypothetical protein [uncultured Nostoc sp.]|uniref:hypothetical protein n=1 Tax=uncultured Nostoc sp. TaxID=340711 RepID=UPI00261FE2FC|nr:hypothetical protein [uncultured Nostoc sp.]